MAGADLVVTDELQTISDGLKKIADEFSNAANIASDDNDIWGQSDAASAMSEFANNWSIHRGPILDRIQKHQQKVDDANQQWQQTDDGLANSFTQS